MSNLWRSVGSERYSTAYLTDSALVYDGPCVVFECGGAYRTASKGDSPTSHNDPDNKWSTEGNAYDDDTDSFASMTTMSTGWSPFLELMYDSDILCSDVRFWAKYHPTDQSLVHIDYWYGTSWQHLYDGVFEGMTWVTKALPALTLISKIRIRFYKSRVGPYARRLYEFDFIRRPVLDAKFYDGFDTTGRQKHRLVLSSTGNAFHRFKKPVYCASGLYVDFVEPAGWVFVRYLPL